MENKLGFRERLQEYLLFFLCRAGVYPFMDDTPCFEFLKEIKESQNLSEQYPQYFSMFSDFPLPDNEDELMTLLTDTLLYMQDRGLVIIGEADYIIPLRDYVGLCDYDLHCLYEILYRMIDYDRKEKYPEQYPRRNTTDE